MFIELLLNAWLIRIGWIVGLILLVVAFWAMIRMSNPSGKKKNPSLSEEKGPLDKIQDQFARGELSKEEYERRKRNIKEGKSLN